MISNYGYCNCCQKFTRFSSKDDWLRDHYICELCGCIPRERALMFTVEKYFPNWKNLIIYESSPNNRGPSIRFKNEAPNYIPSQYFSSSRTGKIINGFRNENLEELTFPDESIDLHITQDVFEHIIEPSFAFKEIARTLKPGGAHIFTTPLVRKNEPTIWCVRRNLDGTTEQLVYPKEFHGNPISEEGSLVTVHWGYDITSFIYSCCGLFTEIVDIESHDFGIKAELNEVLITRKPE